MTLQLSGKGFLVDTKFNELCDLPFIMLKIHLLLLFNYVI